MSAPKESTDKSSVSELESYEPELSEADEYAWDLYVTAIVRSGVIPSPMVGLAAKRDPREWARDVAALADALLGERLARFESEAEPTTEEDGQ